MNLTDCYIEEDLFPKIFTKFEERDYGILFYNTENKDSFDSNHAVIYRERIQNLQAVLLDIAEFYKAKGSRPIIYQSMLDDNWFDEIKDELAASGYRSWIENQEFMFLKEKNTIVPNPQIEIRKVEKWTEEIENVLIEAEEPWEIRVAKKTLEYLGARRALFYRYVEWCKETKIENCYIWPDGETPKRIYEESGYRLVEICRAGRAVMEYE